MLPAHGTVVRADFDLDKLRNEVAPSFKAYEEAVQRGESAGAHSAKMSITRMALSALRAILPHPEAKGLYLFAGADRLSELRYIGKSSPGTLFGRLEKRLRDETCLDATLYGRSREDVWDVAYRRICVSMGRPRAGRANITSPETMLGYAFDHVKTAALFAESTRVILIISDAVPAAVKAAESLLIYSAVSGGAPLLNIQERDKLTTGFHGGAELAMEVIRQAGIDTAHWIDRATSLLGRFQGKCC